MSIVPVGTNNDFLNQHPYLPARSEESSAHDDQAQGYTTVFNRVAGNTFNGDKVELSRNRTGRTNGSFGVSSGQPLAGKEQRAVISDRLTPATMNAYGMDRANLPFLIDSESLSGQYSIGKFGPDMTNPVINKYREAQAYRYWVTTTIEIYV